MRIFVTGASGWIGSHVVDELLSHGHEVLGLARSDASADGIRAKGADVLRGDLDDLEALRRGAETADAVVHLANKHDFADAVATNAAERAAVQTLGDALVDTGKPLAFASGIAFHQGGTPLTEDVPTPWRGPDAPRGGSEALGLEFAERGVRAIAVRFAPTVHGVDDHGFIAFLVQAAREAGAALVADDGANRWCAVHAADAAVAVRLGVERAPAGSILHAVGEEGVPTSDIAAAIGEGLGLPLRSVPAAELAERLGFIGDMFGRDLPASSARTRELLGWTPTGRSLLDDLRGGAYFPV